MKWKGRLGGIGRQRRALRSALGGDEGTLGRCQDATQQGGGHQPHSQEATERIHSFG